MKKIKQREEKEEAQETGKADWTIKIISILCDNKLNFSLSPITLNEYFFLC